ncbi:oligopeptide/dipeptide ABC transporter ATP-binding protein [Inquilinus sp. YAF38]|uniref:oligopeptide/dipeptide ABC transporter ATP-binding protein n=1 Tax=Inquilinus sp. YAF38 TaxID=3233084 RepID=UPI003F92B8A9
MLKGELPSPLNPPLGCAFHRRCPYATDVCQAERPELRAVDGREVACHHAEIVG